MNIPAEGLDVEQTYKLLTGIIVPRPIAWITTINKNGLVNLAPFSGFTFVSAFPPMVGVNMGRKAGVMKDTPNNIHSSGEFVVNIADDTMIDALHQSSAEYPADVSEADILQLRTSPSTRVKPPRLADAPASLECRLHQVLEFGDTGSQFIIGDVLLFHVRDDLYDNGKIDSALLRPIARLGGPIYGKLGEIVRPIPIPLSPQTIFKR